MGAADHGTWQGTLVFDGARAFEGVTPDLDLHCARIVRSAEAMGLAPPLDAGEIEALIREGVRRLGSDRAALPPADDLVARRLAGDHRRRCPNRPRSRSASRTCRSATPGPMTLTVSPFRRPPPDAALCEAKAACHYPNNARIVREARARGFHNALSLDQAGHVAETASTNVFLVRDGVVMTPVANGTFLAGITRQRVIALLRADGVEVVEAPLTVADFAAADEIFLTGNANKVMPVTRFEDRELGPRPDRGPGAGALLGLRPRRPGRAA